jgi:hypothetical protein
MVSAVACAAALFCFYILYIFVDNFVDNFSAKYVAHIKKGCIFAA